MHAQWYVEQNGQARGPLGLHDLADLFYRGEVSAHAQVYVPDRGWTKASAVDALWRAFAEREQRWKGWAGPAPAPPPGEPWFFPMSTPVVWLLDLASFGTYEAVWRYRHWQWLRDRQGLPTSSHFAFGDDADLKLEIAHAADRLNVRRGFTFGPGKTADTFYRVFLFFCCWPLFPLVSAAAISDLQNNANRVNQVVAPGVGSTPLRLAELAVAVPGLIVWGVIALLVSSAG